MKKDYNNNDYLYVSVKSNQLNRILTCYKALGWREVKREDDRQYYDMKYLTLSRPHRIDNKDRLQYLQVRMETEINNISSSFVKKHLKSATLTLILLIAALVCMSLGIALLIAFSSQNGLIWGCVLMCLSAAFTLLTIFPSTLLRKKENSISVKKVEESTKLISSLIAEAESLAPSYNEQEEQPLAIKEGVNE